ncbi:hypothetical protein Slin15195_G104170 [Septoria linicola]|uniref:Uncharacterized protein n=1 Tax=Septoria linicola TaxID=215465 RepID=A0A9Q9B1B9_9PEZI|nr:hypothetical protein Slin14017_G067210 [Septoria linicola]USW57098.1 hypothetical protein Slin15195_G104170 [Septoria linicola]
MALIPPTLPPLAMPIQAAHPSSPPPPTSTTAPQQQPPKSTPAINMDLESLPTTATITKLFTPSPLLTLPTSILHTIIHLVLSPHRVSHTPKPHFSPTPTFRLQNPSHPPNLRRTARRSEADLPRKLLSQREEYEGFDSMVEIVE